MAIYRTYHELSRNLVRTSFNTETRIMRVMFRSGKEYVYYNVPRGIYEYISEGSPRGGKRFWNVLARKYQYRESI